MRIAMLLLCVLTCVSVALLAAPSATTSLSGLRELGRAHPEWVLPSWLRGAGPAWSIVGLAGSGAIGLMSHETEVQPGKDAFSCVGWIYLRKEKQFAAPKPGLVLWRLTEGDLPIPYADWRHHDILVHVTFFATEINGRPVNIARWSLYNEGRRPHDVDFFLAIRPYGVNGKLNPIRNIASRGNIVVINDNDSVECQSAPAGFGALNMADGEVSTFAQRGETPPLQAFGSSDSLITAALKFTRTIPPRVAVPFDFAFSASTSTAPTAPGPRIDFHSELTKMIAYWRKRAPTLTMQLPDERYAEAYRASLSYQSILRVAPALQPSRARARAITSTREETWLKLNSFINHQCAPGVYVWCDAFARSSDCAGDFTTGRANAEFAALLRQALFYEEGDKIVLAAGIPQEWLTASGVRLADAVTRFGKFGYALAHDSRKRVIKLELTGEANPPQGFIFQAPLPAAIEKVTIDGKPLQATTQTAIAIPLGARKVEVAYARRK